MVLASVLGLCTGVVGATASMSSPTGSVLLRVLLLLGVLLLLVLLLLGVLLLLVLLLLRTRRLLDLRTSSVARGSMVRRRRLSVRRT